MEQRSIPAPQALFRSRMLPAAACFYGFSALLGLGSAGLLFVPGSLPALVEDLIRGGITSASALRTWQVIHIGLILAGTAWALSMVVCLTLELRGLRGKGLRIMDAAAQWMLRAVNASGIFALGVGIYRLVRYLAAVLPMNSGIYYLYSMLVSEGVMVAQAVFLFVMLRRFLNSVSDSAASMAYTRLSGKIDSVSIPGMTATGFLVLALVDGYLLLERLFTVTIVEEYLNDHYGLLVAEDPILRLSAAAFGLAAVANFLMFRYLRRYKRDSERLIFRSFREKIPK